MDSFAIVTGVKTVVDLAKTIKDVVNDVELKAKSIELYDAIISLQSNIFAMQAENHSLLQQKNDLEAKLMKIKNWEEEKSKYELVEIAKGVHVFGLKKQYHSSLPLHYLCAKCYCDDHKSIIIAEYINSSGTGYFCPTCSTKFYTDNESPEITIQTNNYC